MHSWVRVAVGVVVGSALLVAGFTVGARLKPEPPPPPATVVECKPVACECAPNCRVSGPNGLYLDLMKLAVTGLLTEKDPVIRAASTEGKPVASTSGPGPWTLGPPNGVTMIGLGRLENLRVLMEATLVEKVPGDYIETGA